MEKTKESKTVKVRLMCPEDDSYVELWEAIDHKEGEPSYYGRFTYQDQGTWYYVSDPLGYRELDHSVPDTVTFIACDSDGNECCRYSNADKNPLPKLENVWKNQWLRCMEQLTGVKTEDCFKKWLLSFKDPEKYPKEIENMRGYEENWIYPTREELSCEPISGTEFTYLGKHYAFSAIRMRHTICGVTWMEYHCTDSPAVYNETYHYTYSLDVFGYQFDDKVWGPMYDTATARQVIEDALRQVLTMPHDRFLVITDADTADAGTPQFVNRYKLPELIEHLLGRERNRTKVDQLAGNIRDSFTDYCLRYGKECICQNTKENRARLRKDFPDIPEWYWLRSL